MKPMQLWLIASVVLCSFCASSPALWADETDDYINGIYRDQQELDDYLKSIDATNDYIDQINQAAQDSHEPEDRDEWLKRIGLGDDQPAAGGQQAAPMNAQQAAAALQFMQQALAQQQAQLRAMGWPAGLLPGRAVNLPAPKPAVAPVANVARPKLAVAPAPPMSLADLATGKYNMAMMLAKAGKSDAAEDYCKFIVKSYPGTAGAKNAQAYLDKPVEQ
jgi:TolA-binding protein